MDNNKNRHKDRPKSNAKTRKMYPKDGSDIGVEDGKKIGGYANSKDRSGVDEYTY